MSQPDFTMSVAGQTRKPKTSIYTLMLLLALMALLTGCIFLFLEIRRFGGFGTVRGTVHVTTAPTSTQFAQLSAVSSLVG